MDTTTFLWTLVATVMAGIQVFAGKVVAHEKRDAAFNGIFTYGIAVVIGIVVFAINRNVPERLSEILFFGLASGGIHSIGNYYRIESLKHIDSVMYFPINKILGPVLVVLSGIFLFGDILSTGQFIGIALSLLVPILLISSAEHHRQTDLKKEFLCSCFPRASPSFHFSVQNKPLCLLGM